MNTELIHSATAMSASAASRYVEGPVRRLTLAETHLLAALLRMAHQEALVPRLADAEVQMMKDGGMGSLRFVGDEDRITTREVIHVYAKDEDGVPLDISVNLDQHGNLFELDVWKVDFSPLKRLPEPSEVTLA